MRTIALSTVLTVCLGTSLAAGDITATGGWTEVIDAGDLVSGAGSDLQSVYESATDATILDVTPAFDFYDVYVRRSDTNWSGDFSLYIKRTGDGTGAGSISFGASYKEVTTVDTKFFSGYMSRTGIPIQYKLSGMSVNIAPDSYSTTIIFTIVDSAP